MITPSRIKELLNKKPFKPFRIFLSDGSHHDVPHPEFAWVFGGRVFVGVPARRGGEAEGRINELAILHVTRIEELAAPKAKK
jgi:hypothetical protein